MHKYRWSPAYASLCENIPRSLEDIFDEIASIRKKRIHEKALEEDARKGEGELILQNDMQGDRLTLVEVEQLQRSWFQLCEPKL